MHAACSNSWSNRDQKVSRAIWVLLLQPRQLVEEHDHHCYCGITPAHLEFISDTTPIKQGRLSPGAFVAADGSWIVYPPELAIVS